MVPGAGCRLKFLDDAKSKDTGEDSSGVLRKHPVRFELLVIADR